MRGALERGNSQAETDVPHAATLLHLNKRPGSAGAATIQSESPLFSLYYSLAGSNVPI